MCHLFGRENKSPSVLEKVPTNSLLLITENTIIYVFTLYKPLNRELLQTTIKAMVRTEEH